MPRRLIPTLFLVSSVLTAFFATSAMAQSPTIPASEFLTRRATTANITHYSVDSLALSKIFSTGGHLQITIFPGGANDVTLDLKPAHSPIDATTKFVEGSLSGDREIPTPSFSVYRGCVLGEPHSSVTLTVFSGKLLCAIRRESGERFVFGPAKNDTATGSHILMRERDLLSTTPFTPFKCLTDDMTQPQTQDVAPASAPESSPAQQGKGVKANAAKSFSIGGSTQSTSTLLQADVAVEADTCFFKAAGGDLATVNGYIVSLFAMSSAIYEDEANVTFHLTNVHVWTNTDPYNVKGNAYAMDAIVRPYWRAHYTSIPRDLAHIMTSIGNGGGGYGWYSLCDDTISYSYSSPQTGHAYPTFAFTYDAYIVSHEIGHNFSLRHGHDCWWAPPLDTCWTKDDTILRRNASNGDTLGQLALPNDACCGLPITPRPSAGTIMSYCPNANYVLAFGDFSKYTIDMTFSHRGGDSIHKFAGLAQCITPPAQPIVILTNPRGSETYSGNTILPITWSSANVNSVILEYSTDGGSSWNSIPITLPASTGSYGWKVPNISSTSMLVRIFDASNGGVGDTSLLFFTVTPSSGVGNSSGTETAAKAISFSLVPDPAWDAMRIVPSESIVNLKSEILDERGIVLQRVDGNADVSSGLGVSLKALPAGAYFLHIASPVDRVISFTHYQ